VGTVLLAGASHRAVPRIWPRSWPRLRIYDLLLGVPMLAWQLAFFAAPLGFLVALSFWSVRNYRLSPDFRWTNWETVLGQPHFWQAYAVTSGMAAGAALLVSAIAFPCAYAIAFRCKPSIARLATLLLVVPFFSSYLVRVYSWQVFLSDNGIINAALGLAGVAPLPLLNSMFGTFVGYATLSLPLVVMLQLFGLTQVDRTLIEAARNLGCSPLRGVVQVIVPAARPAIVMAALFCFILTFGDFVSPLYLGGGKQVVLSTLITDTTKAGQQWPRAAVVALMMIGTLLATALAATWYAYRAERP